MANDKDTLEPDDAPEGAHDSVSRPSPEGESASAIDTTQLRCSCVIDTNVILELYSIHDLMRDFEESHAKKGEAAAADPRVRFRRLRMADSLALAIALHEKRETSFQLVTEAIEMLVREVPPDSDGFERSWVQFFLYYTKDFCLADWGEESDSELGAGVKGTARDSILLDVARAKGVPLVTNEGNTQTGIDDTRGLRKRAIAARVAVCTPGEYVARLGVEFPAASMAFAARFRGRQEEYLAGRSDADAAREHLAKIFDIYAWCFAAARERAEALSR
jgi:hypothetical protein